MKTALPLIITARIALRDLAPLDDLRRLHFPPDRNFLRAHLTMFHRLPGEYRDRIIDQLSVVAEQTAEISAHVSGVRHLGAGVAFAICSPELQDIRSSLKRTFMAWLTSQDMRAWAPHVTIQNKATKAAADRLYKELGDQFIPYGITIIGLDLWRYLGGPWQHERTVDFGATA